MNKNHPKYFDPNHTFTTVHEGELITEEWRAVPDYEGLYEVSSFGRVKSLDREVYRKIGGNYFVEEKIKSVRLEKMGI